MYFGAKTIKPGTNVRHTSTTDYRYRSNQNYPIWPPNPRWPPYDCSYLGIHQYKTPYCSHNSMKLHAYVLYVPCDTLQIISYIKFPKWPPNTLWPTRIQYIESAIFIYVCQNKHVSIKKHVNIVYSVYSS